MKTISFIIPVYNSASYIEECLSSILKQGMAESDYEIIVIDDGSTDESACFINNLIISNSSVSFNLITQENAGLSAARNVGLKVASGKYILFLDSDDYYFDNSLLSLVKMLQQSNCDIIGFGWQLVNEIGKSISDINTQKCALNLEYSGAEFLNTYILQSLACVFAFSSAFLQKQGLRFKEGIYHEDELFTPLAFVHAQSVMCIDNCIYAYRQHRKSVTGKNDKEFSERLLNDRMIVLEELLLVKEDRSLTQYPQRGLMNKMDFFSMEMFINLIRMQMNHRFIVTIVDRMRSLKLYPIPIKRYNNTYFIFSILSRFPRFIAFISWTGILKKS